MHRWEDFTQNQNWNSTFIFRFHCRPIQLVMFLPVGLLSFLHLRQVLLGVELSSVVRPGQLTFGVLITNSFNC
jgi:hypothetical protein